MTAGKVLRIELSNSCGECHDWHWIVMEFCDTPEPKHRNISSGWANQACGIEKTPQEALEKALKAEKKIRTEYINYHETRSNKI